MRPQRLSSRVVFPNREWSSNCGRTELEKRSFAGQRRAFLSISLEVPYYKYDSFFGESNDIFRNFRCEGYR